MARDPYSPIKPGGCGFSVFFRLGLPYDLWAVADLDAPRLLHRDSSRGYTDQPVMALAREPEAITEEEQRAMSTQSRAAFSEQRAEENERRDRRMWMDRLRKAEQRASSKGVDIFKPQTQIRQQILAIERLVDGG